MGTAGGPGGPRSGLSVSRAGGPGRLSGVDGLSFVASLVRSLAWPAAVVTAVMMLRRPLVGWQAVPPRRVKVAPGWGRGRARAASTCLGLGARLGQWLSPWTSLCPRQFHALTSVLASSESSTSATQLSGIDKQQECLRNHQSVARCPAWWASSTARSLIYQVALLIFPPRDDWLETT
jgi:hypothetical protein